MKNDTKKHVASIGIDLGDRMSTYCVLDERKEFMEHGEIPTAAEAFRDLFRRFGAALVCIEAGTHSFWVHSVLQSMGHDVVVLNPRKLKLLTRSLKKTDRSDSEILARVVLSELDLVSPVCHRRLESQMNRTLLRLRDAAVRARTLLINTVRGTIKPLGFRAPPCSADSFHKRAHEGLPQEVWQQIEPLVEQIGALTATIRRYDVIIRKALEAIPESERLLQVRGVGPVTALSFLATIDDPRRFQKSRMVGPYLGLTPRVHESGDHDPQLKITKAGDTMLRRLLTQAAQYILGSFGGDSDLRRYGDAISERGGKNARKRAVVAVARKLAVLLHALWVSGETYEPLRNAERQATAA